MLLDKCVREVLEMEKADQDDVWEEVKKIISGDIEKRKEFIDKVVSIMVKKLIYT